MALSVFHLLFSQDDGRWQLQQDGVALVDFASKSEAAAEGQRRCRRVHEGGHTAELVIHDTNGAIEREWTYGGDVRRED